MTNADPEIQREYNAGAEEEKMSWAAAYKLNSEMADKLLRKHVSGAMALVMVVEAHNFAASQQLQQTQQQQQPQHLTAGSYEAAQPGFPVQTFTGFGGIGFDYVAHEKFQHEFAIGEQVARSILQKVALTK